MIQTAMTNGDGSNISGPRLRIDQCPDPMMWYADKVGQEVPFVREDDDAYWSREDAGFINRVEKEDATPIHPTS